MIITKWHVQLFNKVVMNVNTFATHELVHVHNTMMFYCIKDYFIYNLNMMMNYFDFYI